MIEIGRSKRATSVYGFDDIAIVPTRRTRTPSDVNLGWTIDACTFDFPIANRFHFRIHMRDRWSDLSLLHPDKERFDFGSDDGLHLGRFELSFIDIIVDNR